MTIYTGATLLHSLDLRSEQTSFSPFFGEEESKTNVDISEENVLQSSSTNIFPAEASGIGQLRFPRAAFL